MDWIKAKYDRVTLLVASLALLVSSTFVILGSLGFQEIFSNYLAPISKNNKIQEIDAGPIGLARQALAEPAKWKTAAGSLFVSQTIIVDNGRILKVGPEMPSIYAEVPTSWFFKNKLNMLQGGILEQDADDDRFNNLEEFRKNTDPNDAKSHPPYTDKLILKKYIAIPFRVVFSARDGETFQINTIDLRQPTQFLKVGDDIAGTKFRIESFAEKSCVGPLGTPKDCSELTIRNVTDNTPMILVLGQIANSPDVYGEFFYLWDSSTFKKKKDEEFQLKPDDVTTYKLIDIDPAKATIQILGKEEKITIPTSR